LTISTQTSVLTTAMISLSSTSTSWVTSKSTMQQSSHMKPSTATTITTHQPTSFSHITPSTGMYMHFAILHGSYVGEVINNVPVHGQSVLIVVFVASFISLL
jgi:hypothetical protein